MRIDVVCADRGIAPGGTKGASIHLRAIARALGDAGHDVMTYTSRTAEPGFDLPWRSIDVFTDRGRRPAPDFVYERLSLGHTTGLRAARAWGVPFGLEVNAPLVHEAIRFRPDTVRPDHREDERTLLREADLVFAVSSPLAAWVRDVRGRSAGVHTVWNGVDVARFPVASADATERPRLIFLGDPKPWHGGERLIPVLAGVRRSHDARLRIIGGGPGAEHLAAAAQDAGLGDVVECTGRAAPSRVGTFLADGTIGVAPYPAIEPFYFCPLKVLEYMAAGLPTITTDQGDLGRIVDDGGILLEPHASVDDWVRAVVGLLDDGGRRRKLGANARRRAQDNLSWSVAAEQLSRLIGRASAERRS